MQALFDNLKRNEDSLPSMGEPNFSNRRSSILLAEKLVQKWGVLEDLPEGEVLGSGESSSNPTKSSIEKEAEEYKLAKRLSLSTFKPCHLDLNSFPGAVILGADPIYCYPKKISVQDMVEVLFECINEETIRRESLINLPPPKPGMRRGSVQVVRPENAEVMKDAEYLASIINSIIDMPDAEVKKIKERRKINSRQIALEMAKIIPEGQTICLDLKEEFVEDPE